MANNNQLSYQTATIDPTIAGYAARDPGFALGLLLGRGWVENYNERGIRKLQESLKGKDGLTPAGEPANPSEQSQTNSETASADNAKQVPQIFSANQSPTMQTVNAYQPQAVNASEPMTDTQKAVMENAVANASTPQAGDTGYKDALMARVRNILYDPNNQWAQSAARGAIYNKLKEMGDPGGGNPYAMGNYIDPSKNFSQQALAQSFANKWTPQTVMNADGTVTQNPAPGYVASNPLQGASMYAIQGNANQGIQSPDMAAQFRAYLNGETPQTAPVLDAVQTQQAVADNTQNVIPPQAKTANFTDAEQDKKSDEPVQQEQASQEEPTVSKSETVATEQNSQNGKTVQSALQNNVQPTPLKPFSVKDWIAKVTQAGIAQGRPMNQIQAVISRGLPAAQAAEDNYKKQAVDGLLNRIYNGDETTGGKNLLPTMENANTAVPKLMQTLNEIDSIDPERGAQIRAILPSYNTFLKENINNFNKARDVGYSKELASNALDNAIKQKEAFTGIDLSALKAKYAMMSEREKQQRNLKYQALVDAGYGQQEAAAYAMGIVPKSMLKGATTGTQQQQTVNGSPLTGKQKERMEELDYSLQDLTNTLYNYMAKNSKDSLEGYGNAIANLQEYLDNLKESDKVLLPKGTMDKLTDMLYAANAKREALAGHYAGSSDAPGAREYASALTDEAKKKYGINFNGGN